MTIGVPICGLWNLTELITTRGEAGLVSETTECVRNLLWWSEQAQQTSARHWVVEHPRVGENPMPVFWHCPR